MSEDENEDDISFFTDMQFGYLTRQTLINDQYHGEYDIIRAILTPDEYNVENVFENMGTPTIDALIEMVTNGVIDYDLLTIYNIYKARENCMRVDSQYAKNKVLAMLTRLFTIPNASLFSIYYYYKFLMLNYFVFDINVKYVELETLPLYIDQPLSLENNTQEEVIRYLMKALGEPLDVEFYDIFKQQLIIKLNQLLSGLINHVKNL